MKELSILQPVIKKNYEELPTVLMVDALIHAVDSFLFLFLLFNVSARNGYNGSSHVWC